jgi:tRNA (guanine37-N1)-methyltransferase
LRKRLREKLSNALPPEQLGEIYSSFDIIGDLAIIKVPDPTNAEATAKQIMATHKNLKAVYSQTSGVRGEFRVRELKLLAGENKTTTCYRENGCLFNVDIERCYFSPRLSYERGRIANLVGHGETVVNMFAGVGCFSVIIAKKVPAAKVYSIDVNPTAYQFMQQNIELNRVQDRVVPLLGDAKEVVEAQLCGVADRVLMPLPELAVEYLPYALSALKKGGGWIHLHDFEHATAGEAPTEKTRSKVAQKLGSLDLKYEFPLCRVVRSTGPNWWQTVIDIHVS